MASPNSPPSEPAPAYTPGGIEWETPRPRPAKPSLLRRIFPGTGPSRTVPTAADKTEPTSTLPAQKPDHPPSDLSNHTPNHKPALLDRTLPPNRRYLRLRRTPFLILLLGLSLSALALILGLSIGLTRRRSSTASLPLPTSAGIHTGDLTYYAPALGACGWTSSPDDAIVAISREVFDAAMGGRTNPNENPLCGKRIRVERDQGGGKGNKSVDVVVVDRCVGCKPTDLDLSPSAFVLLAPEELGRVLGSWAWL